MAFIDYKKHMTRKNALVTAPPYQVEQAVGGLGANLRRARLRRNLTIAEVAAKIGTGPRAVQDAEKGTPGTSVVVYAALLWAYDLLSPFRDLADPATDEGALDRESLRERARPSRGLSDDF
jgi:transcriptional regulator with XRE-family HTH domain